MTVQDIRSFNRFYTNLIGALDYGRHLYAPYTLTESRVLYELAHSPRTDVADLRTQLHLDAGYLTRILNRFEEDGLVERGPSERDPRRRRIRLTPRGRETAELLDERARQTVGALLAGVAPEDRPRLAEALRTVRTLLSGARRTSSCAIPPPATSAGSCSATPRCTPPSTAGTPSTRRWWRGSSPTSRRITIRVGSGCGSPSWTGGRWGV
jgi:DNA-binding MarR family transcriptional regulator